MIGFHLLLGLLHCRAGGNNACAGLAAHRMSERITRSMPLRALLSAVAGWFSAFAVAGHQRTGPHLANLRDAILQLVAFDHQGIQVRMIGHKSLLTVAYTVRNAGNPQP